MDALRCIPIYLGASLQFFADTRSAPGLEPVSKAPADFTREFETELAGIPPAINAAEREGR